MPTLDARVFEVSRGRPFDDVRIVQDTIPEPGADEILLEIERLSLATNNLAYVLLGDRFGHWRAFPAQPGWGRPPAWASARVIAGDPAIAPIGQRVTGYLPLATHILVRAEATNSGAIAVDEHRADALPLYRRLTFAPHDGHASEHADIDTVFLPVYPFAGVLASDLTAAARPAAPRRPGRTGHSAGTSGQRLRSPPAETGSRRTLRTFPTTSPN